MRPWSVVTMCVALLALFVIAPTQINAGEISFAGNLDDVQLDLGGAVYSGVSEGTAFSGVIDDVTADGEITGGGISTSFSCCIAAGALELSDNVTVTAEIIDELSMLPGLPTLSLGDMVDLIDLEGDETTPGGGRIEVGLSFVLKPDAFDSEDLSNYPFDSADLLFTLFFIVEEGPSSPSMPDNDIYAALGVVNTLSVPEPDEPDPTPVRYRLPRG